MTDAEWTRAIEKNKRFVAFVDVLGYKSIVTDPATTDVAKAKRLAALFENLGEAFYAAMDDWNHGEMPGATAKIDAISFSDCFYFSSDRLGDLVAFVAHLFGQALDFQEGVYDDPDCWVPFLRGAVARGWCLSFRDFSLAKRLPDSEGFRNPVGPAIAKAYTLSEEVPALPGMSIVLDPECLDLLHGEHHDTPTRHLAVKWPSRSAYAAAPGGRILADEIAIFPATRTCSPVPGAYWEVDWFTNVIRGNNGTCVLFLERTRRQFGSHTKHYFGTVDVALKAALLRGESRLAQEASRILDECRPERTAEE